MYFVFLDVKGDRALLRLTARRRGACQVQVLGFRIWGLVSARGFELNLWGVFGCFSFAL